MITQKLTRLFFLVAFLVAQSACAALEPAKPPTATATIVMTSTVEPSATPIPPTSTLTPVPTPTFEFAVPSPSQGNGTVIGLVLWNKEPVANAIVRMSEDFDYVTWNYKGTKYSTKSNNQGYYIFKDVKPGEYVVFIDAFSTGDLFVLMEESGLNITSSLQEVWVYSMQNALHKDTVKSDEITILDPRSIYKLDLNLNDPDELGVVLERQPTFTWEEYPSAAYYIVEVSEPVTVGALKKIEEGTYDPFRLESPKIESGITSFTATQPLEIDKQYSWCVSAYDESGTKIAQCKSSGRALPGNTFYVKNP